MWRRELYAFLALVAFQSIASGSTADPLPPPEEAHKVKTIRILPDTPEERAGVASRSKSPLSEEPNLRIEPNPNGRVVRTIPIRPGSSQ
jgi:hypothetical protein